MISRKVRNKKLQNGIFEIEYRVDTEPVLQPLLCYCDNVVIIKTETYIDVYASF